MVFLKTVLGLQRWLLVVEVTVRSILQRTANRSEMT